MGAIPPRLDPYRSFTPPRSVKALPNRDDPSCDAVWLFAGIRGDEIRRLRVGCVRWQPDNGSSVCFLDVPVNKTGTAFTKPVNGVVA
jgi:hypothetical protein